MHPKTSALLASGLVLLSAGFAAALPIARSVPDIRRLADGAFTSAPTPFIKFCLSNPAECSVSGQAESIALTPARMDELRSVNASVNKIIREKADPAGTDVWQINVRAGDCEDFAIQKRHELIAKGWPSGALSLAMVLTDNFEGHLVLTVRGEEGDVVLDNRRGDIVTWQGAGYRWLKRQSAANPRYWVKIDTSVPVAAMPQRDVQVADTSVRDERF